MAGDDAPPQSMLAIGFLFISLGVGWMIIGKASNRYRWVYRSEEPVEFWFLVAMAYLGGLCLVGYYCYESYGQSHHKD